MIYTRWRNLWGFPAFDHQSATPFQAWTYNHINSILIVKLSPHLTSNIDKQYICTHAMLYINRPYVSVGCDGTQSKFPSEQLLNSWSNSWILKLRTFEWLDTHLSIEQKAYFERLVGGYIWCNHLWDNVMQAKSSITLYMGSLCCGLLMINTSTMSFCDIFSL